MILRIGAGRWEGGAVERDGAGETRAGLHPRRGEGRRSVRQGKARRRNGGARRRAAVPGPESRDARELAQSVHQAAQHDERPHGQVRDGGFGFAQFLGHFPDGLPSEEASLNHLAVGVGQT